MYRHRFEKKKSQDGDGDEPGSRGEAVVEEQAPAVIPGAEPRHDCLLCAHDLEGTHCCELGQL